jgi:hypothetical protein
MSFPKEKDERPLKVASEIGPPPGGDVNPYCTTTYNYFGVFLFFSQGRA